MPHRICLRFLNTVSLRALTVLLATVLILPVHAGTVVEYRHDAAGNIVSIERSGAALAINGFSPESGPIGAEVVIYGSGFSASASGNVVFFSGVQTEVFYASSSSLVVEVPAGATTGPISVNVGANTVTSLSVFTVTDHYAAPEIENFSPSCGAVGTIVTVKGKNFDPAPGATQAGIADLFTNASVTNAGELTFSAPSKAATGHIRVATPSGIADSKGYFFIPPSGSGITCANLGGNLTPIAIGQSKNINIASGDRAVLVFDAQADDLLSFYLSNIVKTPSNASVSYSIYGINGTLWKSGSTAGQAATFSPPPIPASGTYVLSLSVGSSGSANLSIRLARDPIIAANADSLPLGTEAPSQTLRFGILAEPGQSLGVGLSQLTYSVASTSGTGATLLDPDGNAYTSNSHTGSSVTCNVTQKQCGLNLPIIKQAGIYSVQLTPPTSTAISIEAALSDNIQGHLQADTRYTIALNRIGQDGWLTFDGEKDQSVGIGISGYTSTPANAAAFYIFKPDGTLLKSTSTSGSAAYIEMSPLPTTGTYTVWISPTNGAQATMTLLLDTGDLLQADGSSKTAQSADIGGTLRFTFDAEIGQSLGIGISNLTYSPTGTSGASVQFLGPDGKSYTSNSHTGSSVTCNVTQKQCDLNLPIVKQTGRHTVLLTPPSGIAVTATATLSSNVQSKLVLNTPYALTLNRIGQDGWLTFEGEKDQSIGIGISGYTSNPANATARFYVFKPDGTLLKNTSTSGSASYIEMSPLPETGAYTVWISPTNGAQATMTLLLDAGTMLQADGSSKTAQSANFGGTVRFTFDAEIGQSLGIGISNLTYSPTGTSGTSVQFLGPDGKTYTSNSYAGNSVTCNATQKQCDLNLPIVKQTGRHTVLLTPPSGITATATATLSNNVQSKLMPDIPYTLALNRIGQDGWLAFDGVAGESRSLTFSATSIQSPGTSFTAYVFKPDGTFLKSLSLNPSGGKLDLGSLPSTGTYQLWVNPNYGATAITSITLQ